MSKFKIEKLGRDKLLLKPEFGGVRVLDLEEYRSELVRKLLEEAAEVEAASSREELAEELADVMEVLECLMDAYEIQPAEVARIQKEKQERKGSFRKRLYAEYIELDPKDPLYRRLQADPDRYPELRRD